MIEDVLTYREMCNLEDLQTLQRGMNFNINLHYSIILMSRRSNAPYRDRVLHDGITIEYEGHDEPQTSHLMNSKELDQPVKTKNGKLTQNGLFIRAVEQYKKKKASTELVKVYEKLFPGVWSLKGIFELIDFRIENDGKRNVFIFKLTLSENQGVRNEVIELEHTRLISSDVKKEVWKRDKGRCVKCGVVKNLHFDHDLPFSKGGTSLLAKNIKLLCAQCNLSKSDKIE